MIYYTVITPNHPRSSERILTWTDLKAALTDQQVLEYEYGLMSWIKIFRDD